MSEKDELALSQLEEKHIQKMAQMEGWQILKRKYEERIEALMNRVLSSSDTGSIETTETKKVGDKTYITIIQINRDEFKHEIKFIKALFARVKDSEEG